MGRYFFGIAGGSGSGKTTLAYNLQKKYPSKIEVLEVDDFQKSSKNLPLLDGMPNRDHPDSVYFNKLISKQRYKVERTCGGMKRWFGAGKARYVGLSKTHSQHVLEAIAYNLYRSPGIIMSKSLV